MELKRATKDRSKQLLEDDAEAKSKVKFLNEFYISYRHKFILQNKNGNGYITIKRILSDTLVTKHVKGIETVGFSAGNQFTKLIGFDIDVGQEEAPAVAKELIQALIGVYGFNKDNILPSFSGNKGIHVDVFIDKIITVVDAQLLYELVLLETGYNDTQVEFRATNTQGYKLPMGIHRVTGNYMYLLDVDTLERVEDSYREAKVKADIQAFREMLKAHKHKSKAKPPKAPPKPSKRITEDDIEELQAVMEGTKFVIPKEHSKRMLEILEANRLPHAGTRNNTTLLLSIFLKDRGHSLSDTQAIVGSVMENTYKEARELINASTSLEYALQETLRISSYVYEQNYTIGENKRTDVKLYKSYVDKILEQKGLVLQRLYMTHLIHSLQHASKDGNYYMTYEQMAEAGNTANRTRACKLLLELEDAGALEIVQRNKRYEKVLKSEANKYNVKLPVPEDDEEYLIISQYDNNDFVRIVAHFYTEKEIRQMLGRHIFTKHFKTHYKAMKD